MKHDNDDAATVHSSYNITVIFMPCEIPRDFMHVLSNFPLVFLDCCEQNLYLETRVALRASCLPVCLTLALSSISCLPVLCVCCALCLKRLMFMFAVCFDCCMSCAHRFWSLFLVLVCETKFDFPRLLKFSSTEPYSTSLTGI